MLRNENFILKMLSLFKIDRTQTSRQHHVCAKQSSPSWIAFVLKRHSLEFVVQHRNVFRYNFILVHHCIMIAFEKWNTELWPPLCQETAKNASRDKRLSDIVAAGILAGPGMAEGGAFKKRRDAFTMHIALQHKVANSMLDLEELGRDLLGRRMKLTMSQLQFVDKVCLVPPSFHVVMYSSCSCDTTRLRMLPDHAEDHT